MKHTQFRIGNVFEYQMVDSNDKRKKWWEKAEMDAESLFWLTKNTEDEDYRGLKVNEEILRDIELRNIDFHRWEKTFTIESGEKSYEFNYSDFIYLHQIQNLYHSIKSKEIAYGTID